MKLKLDEAGHAVLQDEKPVYVHDDGKEVAFDVPMTVATITRLNGEAKANRERAETAETRLKAFEGIEDAEAARRALTTVKNLDDKKLVDAGKVEEIKAAAIAAVEEKYKPVVADRDKYRQQLDNEIVGGSFARSKFADEKVAVPRHMLQATYGKNFKAEEGKLVPYDAAGNKIFSRARPGEIADFDEALELIISSDPYKDHILKGSNASGDGARSSNGSGSNSGGVKTMKRADFDKLGPAEQMKAVTVDNIAVAD